MKFIIHDADKIDSHSLHYAISVMQSYITNNLKLDEVKKIRNKFGRKNGVLVSRGDRTDVTLWKTPGAVHAVVEFDLEYREQWFKTRQKVSKKDPK